MNKRGIPLLIATFLLLAAGCSANRLTNEMKQKLDPHLIRLLEGHQVVASDYDQSVRPDGTKEFGVIISGTNPAEIRELGIHLNSVFGEVMTARLSTAELLKVIRLPSVRSVRTGDRPSPLR